MLLKSKIYKTFFHQFDSPELLEMPEIKEMMKKFTKLTKYLIKLKEILINYVWEESHVTKL